jgi:hypothetical protein
MHSFRVTSEECEMFGSLESFVVRESEVIQKIEASQKVTLATSRDLQQ